MRNITGRLNRIEVSLYPKSQCGTQDGTELADYKIISNELKDITPGSAYEIWLNKQLECTLDKTRGNKTRGEVRFIALTSMEEPDRRRLIHEMFDPFEDVEKLEVLKKISRNWTDEERALWKKEYGLT